MTRIGRYEIRHAIANTGTGAVYVAWDPSIERTVVVKTLDRPRLPPEYAGEILARFRREAIAAGRLTHPGIVTVYECGDEGDLSYIVMEHAQGPTLRRFLTGQPQPPLDVVAGLARQLFAALIYAHEQGVVHRDLKPTNIVLAAAEAGSAGRPKILDFGIARIETAASLTHAGSIVGTPGYMAPEQYLGDTTDARTDIYALGVMLFELVTGQRPFLGELDEVLRQATSRAAPLASSVRAGLPPALDAVLARALERRPADRFTSMREFREACVAAFAPALAVAAPLSALPAAVTNAPIDLPLEPTTAVTAASQGHATLPLRRLAPATDARATLLLVDDEERILGALSALFRLRYEVLTCTDGEQALELVRQHRPDVIISDQRMPRMPGVEFLRRSREIDASAVRILLTGYSDLAAIVGSINDGEVFRFVHKPWGNQELRDTVAQAVEIARATRQAGTFIPTQSAAATAPPAPETPQRRAGEAIVVAEPGRELFDLVNEAFGRTRPVCHATDVASVLQAVEDEEVAVLLCDLDQLPGADVMLKLLKQSHPRVQSVALAEHSDSDDLVALINEAQILRFLNRPLRIGLLDRALRSALAAHATTKAAPVLAARQAVTVRAAVRESSVGQQILRRLATWLRPMAAESTAPRAAVPQRPRAHPAAALPQAESAAISR